MAQTEIVGEKKDWAWIRSQLNEMFGDLYGSVGSQSDLTQTDNTEPDFVKGKDEFKAEIISEAGSSWTTVKKTSSFTAVKNTIYIVNSTTAPVVATIPNPVVGNTDEFWFVLDSAATTHKLTISNTSESFTIPTFGGFLILKCNGVTYDIVLDGRSQEKIEIISEDREFSTDGIENNVTYIISPLEGGTVTITLPDPQNNSQLTVKSKFILFGEGIAKIVSSVNIGDSTEQILNLSGTSLTIIDVLDSYFISDDTRPKILSSSIATYPLSEDSTINDTITGTFFKQRCTTIEDTRFNKNTSTELNAVVTANPTDSWQCVSSSITDAGVLLGQALEGQIEIYLNARRTVRDVNVYVGYWLRNSGGVETFLGVSSQTTITGTTEAQYRLVAFHSEFNATATDRIVIRIYARKASTGSNPTFYHSVEGINPTRSIIEIGNANISIPMSSVNGLESAINEINNTVQQQILMTQIFS